MESLTKILLSGLSAAYLSSCSPSNSNQENNNSNQTESRKDSPKRRSISDLPMEQEETVKENPTQKQGYSIDLGDGVKIKMSYVEGKIKSTEYTKRFTLNSYYETEDLTDTHGQLFTGETSHKPFFSSEPITLQQYEQFLKKTGYDGKKDVYPGDRRDYMDYPEDEKSVFLESPVFPIAYNNAKAFADHVKKITKKETSLPNAYQVLILTAQEIDSQGKRTLPSRYEKELIERIKEKVGENLPARGAFVQEYIFPESAFYLTNESSPPFSYFIGARKLERFPKIQKSSPSGGIESLVGTGSISKIPRMFRIVQPAN